MYIKEAEKTPGMWFAINVDEKIAQVFFNKNDCKDYIKAKQPNEKRMIARRKNK